MRILIDYEPYARKLGDDEPPYQEIGVWPCRWVHVPEAGRPPFVTAYCRRFTLEQETAFRAHASADERYELFLDGARVGRGPERGDPDRWCFETYDFELAAGEHVLVARVWSLGADYAPFAQMFRRSGFIFSPEEDRFIELVGTGVAEWEGKVLDGYAWMKRKEAA